MLLLCLVVVVWCFIAVATVMVIMVTIMVMNGDYCREQADGSEGAAGYEEGLEAEGADV